MQIYNKRLELNTSYLKEYLNIYLKTKQLVINTLQKKTHFPIKIQTVFLFLFMYLICQKRLYVTAQLTH